MKVVVELGSMDVTSEEPHLRPMQPDAATCEGHCCPGFGAALGHVGKNG